MPQTKQWSKTPLMSIDPLKKYTAILHTDKGDITIQLYADKTPVTVNSFVFLARSGWYDNITFHRVIPGYVAQTGDPSGTGMGGPGYLFVDEIVDNLKFDKPGVVGMANSGKDTNGSQFFITYDAQPDLDGQFTIFGQVIKGIEILSLLTPRHPGKDQNLQPGDKLISIRISEK